MDTKQSMQERLVAKAAEDSDFRARLLADPGSAVEEELGIKLPENLNIQVHEEGIDTAHIVLPPSSELTDQHLEMAAGGICGGWRV